MKGIKRWGWTALLGALVLVACQTASQERTSGGAGGAVSAGNAAAAPRELRVGDRAPDFALPDQNRQEMRLDQFRGRPVQVAFYVAAFSSG